MCPYDGLEIGDIIQYSPDSTVQCNNCGETISLAYVEAEYVGHFDADDNKTYAMTQYEKPIICRKCGHEIIAGKVVCEEITKQDVPVNPFDAFNIIVYLN